MEDVQVELLETANAALKSGNTDAALVFVEMAKLKEMRSQTEVMEEMSETLVSIGDLMASVQIDMRQK